MIEKTFKAGGKHYALVHHSSDDSRTVRDGDNNVILRIDSSTRIRDSETALVGDLHGYTGNWILKLPDGTQVDTGITVDNGLRKYCWEKLVEAECWVGKWYIEQQEQKAWADKLIGTSNLYYTGKPMPKLGEPLETEGGTCD